MKTAKQHLQALPEPYGQMAIEETIRQRNEHRLKDKHELQSDALWWAFTWWESEIGFHFWDAIYENCLYLERGGKGSR